MRMFLRRYADKIGKFLYSADIAWVIAVFFWLRVDCRCFYSAPLFRFQICQSLTNDNDTNKVAAEEHTLQFLPFQIMWLLLLIMN
jgi:hypothetical protein